MKVSAYSQSDDLFLNLAEQVKLPFVQISQAAELLNDPRYAHSSKQEIAAASSAALQLIEGYILSIELQRQSQLELEPVSISSVLYDTAEVLDQYAKLYECKLDIVVSGKYAPVMAHKRGMQAALTSLGLSFIEAAVTEGDKQPRIKLAVRRAQGGISTGVFTESHLNSNLLKQARAMQVSARQPLSSFMSGSGTGIFIADALFSRMDSVMKTARLHGMHGLAATLLPSRQLSLV